MLSGGPKSRNPGKRQEGTRSPWIASCFFRCFLQLLRYTLYISEIWRHTYSKRCFITKSCFRRLIIQVMTFGSPKVTDAPGAERLRGVLPVLRVTHERDPVPLMPVADWAIPLPKSSRRRSVADSHRGVWMTDEQPQGVTVDSPRQQDGVTNPRQRHTCAVHPREEAEVNDRPHRLEVAESISRHVEVDVEGLNDSRRSFLDGGGRANAHPESSDGPRRSGMGDGRGRKMFTPSAAYSHFGSQVSCGGEQPRAMGGRNGVFLASST